MRFELLDAGVTRTVRITRNPFTFGRLPESDVVLAHPFVSRQHAEIRQEGEAFVLADLKSRHGTFVNGARLELECALAIGDAVTFGAPDGPSLRALAEEADSSSSLRELIEQMPSGSQHGTGLEKLRWFFESARKLEAFGSVEQILGTLLEITLELTKVERGYVYLFNEAGKLELVLGRDEDGKSVDDATLSRGAIDQAINTSSEYILTDTLSADSRTDSIVAHSIRSVICIPLRRNRGGYKGQSDLLGVLYLDSRIKPGSLSGIDSDLLRTIATNAAALIDNAQLALADDRDRKNQEELSIAAEIQKSLMARTLPTLPYASLAARSIPCREVGGDFFDILSQEQSLAVVVADVSGKGISAAILASTLQGMVYSQLLANQSLVNIATVINRYICTKGIGKYATMAILRLDPQGNVEYINCGHIPPYLRSAEGCTRLPDSNLPVGLIAEAVYESSTVTLKRGDRILIVTDGVTEAEDESGEFFGEDRLGKALDDCAGFETIYSSIKTYCGAVPLNDDCTMVEVTFAG